MYKVTEGKVLQVSNTERSGYVRFHVDGHFADMPDKDFQKFVEFFIKTGKHIVPEPVSEPMKLSDEADSVPAENAAPRENPAATRPHRGRPRK